MLLKTVHGAEPAKTNGAADRLNGRLARAVPLVEHEADAVWEVRVAVGAVEGFGGVSWGVRGPHALATIPGYVPAKGAAGGKTVSAPGAYDPLPLFHREWVYVLGRLWARKFLPRWKN